MNPYPQAPTHAASATPVNTDRLTRWRPGSLLCAARTLALGGLAAVAVLLAGCAAWRVDQRVQTGQTEAEVLLALGPPTVRHALPGLPLRLEYNRGPAGYATWMVDLDSAGRVSAIAQVRNQQHFAEVRDGMPRAELLRLLGLPTQRQRQYLDSETLFWRYSPSACLWFAVTVSAQGRVVNGGGEMPDPRCELPR